jgi:CheY-like chemotaxis protein
VLIVDDNMFNLIPLELLLEEMFDISVDKAMNGQEAVSCFIKNLSKTCCDKKYKLIFMDLNMPIMDGYEATRQILSIQRRASS